LEASVVILCVKDTSSSLRHITTHDDCAASMILVM
jgi:hypothetical protein